MKAFVLHSYGPPDSLTLTEIDRPVPGDGEVLVRVRATSVQPYEWHHVRGEPLAARLMPNGPGLRGPRSSVPGADVAGEVEAVGATVTEFHPGDRVFAMLRHGSFAEYACVPTSELALMPKNLSFEQAAAVPMAANTALIAVRDQGRVEPGQKVLVNGASGGVGTFAVQLARAFGAHVTGVCSTRNVELVRSLGAEEVIDYTTTDFTATGRRYDVLLDVAGSRSLRACRRVMTPKGTFVVVGGQPGRWAQPAGHALGTLLTGQFVSQRVVLADVVACTEDKQNLQTLAALIEEGKVTPVIDRSYPFAEIPAALRYSETGHAPGKIVITV